MKTSLINMSEYLLGLLYFDSYPLLYIGTHFMNSNNCTRNKYSLIYYCCWEFRRQSYLATI